MALTLKTNKPPATGTQQLVATHIEHAIENIVACGTSPRTHLHEARTDLKKARAALRLLRGTIPRRSRKQINLLCRDAARFLSEVRDAQVLPQTFSRVMRRLDRPSTAVESLQERLQAASAAAVKRALADKERLAAAVGVLEEARRLANTLRLAKHGWRGVDDGVLTSFRSARRSYRQLRRSNNAAAHHEWRKRAKDVRYQVEMLTQTEPRVLGKLAKQLHTLTDILGDANDLQVLGERLRRGKLARAAGATNAVKAVIAQRQQDLRARARKLGGSVFAERPQSYRKRLHSYWKDRAAS